MERMTSIKKIVSSGFLLLILAILAWPSLSQAAVSVQGVSGKWSNVTGGANVQGSGSNQIYWGAQSQTKNQKSSYKFDAPAPTIFPVTIGQSFNLGTFTHFNKVIPTTAGITGATLNVKISFNINGTLLQNLPFTFNFQHTETPNLPGKCPPGSASVCDDIVTFTNNHSKSNIFTINGQQYTIDISGFMVNGQLVQKFFTQENKTNVAQLQAIITAVHAPEPSTYLILGSTLMLTMFALRQRKNALKNDI